MNALSSHRILSSNDNNKKTTHANNGNGWFKQLLIGSKVSLYRYRTLLVKPFFPLTQTQLCSTSLPIFLSLQSYALVPADPTSHWVPTMSSSVLGPKTIRPSTTHPLKKPTRTLSRLHSTTSSTTRALPWKKCLPRISLLKIPVHRPPSGIRRRFSFSIHFVLPRRTLRLAVIWRPRLPSQTRRIPTKPRRPKNASLSTIRPRKMSWRNWIPMQSPPRMLASRICFARMYVGFVAVFYSLPFYSSFESHRRLPSAFYSLLRAAYFAALKRLVEGRDDYSQERIRYSQRGKRQASKASCSLVECARPRWWNDEFDWAVPWSQHGKRSLVGRKTDLGDDERDQRNLSCLEIQHGNDRLWFFLFC